MNYALNFLEAMILTLFHGIVGIIRIPGTILRLIAIGTDMVMQRWMAIQARNHYDNLLR